MFEAGFIVIVAGIALVVAGTIRHGSVLTRADVAGDFLMAAGFLIQGLWLVAAVFAGLGLLLERRRQRRML